MTGRWNRGGLCGLLLGALAVAGACGGERGGTSGGDAAAEEVAALDYEVTPDRYDRWVAAQQALDAIPGLPDPPRIDPLRLDEAQINRAAQYLESDLRARAALQRAGISARDYVLTTIALDQALVTAEATDPAAAGSALAPGAPAPGAPTTGGGASGARTTSQPAPTASGRAAATPGTPGGAAPAAARPRPRFAGTPERNVELVRRKRDDVVRVLRTMRFRVSEPAAADLAATDTSVTRSDSVTVGKDITVKWDVTVRRNRDTSAAAQKATKSASDSARRDTTGQDSSTSP